MEREDRSAQGQDGQGQGRGEDRIQQNHRSLAAQADEASAEGKTAFHEATFKFK